MNELTLFLMILLLTICSWHDIKTCTVPPYLTYLALMLATISVAYASNTKVLLIAGFIALVAGWALAEFDIWGGADSQLLIAMALLLGFSWYFVVFLYTGIAYSIAFLVASKIKKKQIDIPFVPVFLISYAIFVVLRLY